MTLDYLLFDHSEGGDDTSLFEALATVGPEREAAVRAEIDAVLGWAARRFRGRRGPVEEGGDWDADLDERQEGPALRSFHLSITGSPAFAEAFIAEFGDAVN